MSIPIPVSTQNNKYCDIISLTLDIDGKLVWAGTDNVLYRHPNEFLKDEGGNVEFGGNDNKFMKLQPLITFLSRTTTSWISQTYDSTCLLYTSPSPRDLSTSHMPSSA